MLPLLNRNLYRYIVQSKSIFGLNILTIKISYRLKYISYNNSAYYLKKYFFIEWKKNIYTIELNRMNIFLLNILDEALL